ncbi:uncharacterized protein MKS88_000111 [Plasmodium brasilianum]|uniref:uncharacterized protein n=1 Tax=Plasmodium brasilianum TaxID=5824 RepID=UPI00350E51CF|nr:hypothetical protein MKS88_000111 [Plasmodium brasilianum]
MQKKKEKPNKLLNRERFNVQVGDYSKGMSDKKYFRFEERIPYTTRIGDFEISTEATSRATNSFFLESYSSTRLRLFNIFWSSYHYISYHNYNNYSYDLNK